MSTHCFMHKVILPMICYPPYADPYPYTANLDLHRGILYVVADLQHLLANADTEHRVEECVRMLNRRGHDISITDITVLEVKPNFHESGWFVSIIRKSENCSDQWACYQPASPGIKRQALRYLGLNSVR